MLKEGAREQPTAGSIAAAQAPTVVIRSVRAYLDACTCLFMSGNLGIQEITSLVGQSRHPR
jgi:hypothetical protein